MRILFVNQYFPPDTSATAYLLGELAHDLAGRHEVWVVAGRPSYRPDAAVSRPAGVRVAQAWSTGFDRASMAGRLVNYATFAVGSFVASRRVPRPDVVVAFTDPPTIGAIGLLAARRHEAPFVQVCMDVFPDIAVELGRLDNPIAVRAWRWLNRILRNAADRIVVVGRDMQQRLESQGVPAERIAFIPNWASSREDDPEAPAATRRDRGWEDRFVVMHAGNVGLAQDLDVLLEAARLLRGDREVLFVVVGEGAARSGLEREARRSGLDNVQFLAFQPKDEVQRTLAAADLHLISLAAGLWGTAVPSKVYGIMAVAKPFIAAVEPGSEVALLAEEHSCGVRVDPGDPDALAEAILKMRGEPLEEMGRSAREAFEQRYERRIATEDYRRLLEKVASEGRR